MYIQNLLLMSILHKEVKVGNDQEMAQSERNSHSTNRRVGKNKMTGTYTKKTYRKPSEQLFPNRQPLSYSVIDFFIFAISEHAELSSLH